MDFPIVFSKSDMTKKNSGKAKHPKICLSFGGSMPDAQIKQCPLTPSPKNIQPFCSVIKTHTFSQCLKYFKLFFLL